MVGSSGGVASAVGSQNNFIADEAVFNTEGLSPAEVERYRNFYMDLSSIDS